jgi:SM-20-related protein
MAKAEPVDPEEARIDRLAAKNFQPVIAHGGRSVCGPRRLVQSGNPLGSKGSHGMMAARGWSIDVAAAAESDVRHFLDLAAFERTPLIAEPFPYLIVPGFVPAAALPALAADYPVITKPGSFPLEDVRYGPAFAGFIAALEGDAMRDAFGRKFGLDLAARPTMITVRGQARPSDGTIHSDAVSKLITVLIYMNAAWEAPGGRLRLLRSATDLDSAVAEVPPEAGTMLAFRVTPHSWHGHRPASGPRRVVQLNWVASERVVRRERLRHGLSARVKRLFG